MHGGLKTTTAMLSPVQRDHEPESQVLSASPNPWITMVVSFQEAYFNPIALTFMQVPPVPQSRPADQRPPACEAQSIMCIAGLLPVPQFQVSFPAPWPPSETYLGFWPRQLPVMVIVRSNLLA